MIFWTAFGAIGTTVDSIATAIAVWVSLKPYKRKIQFIFGMEGSGDEGNRYYMCKNEIKMVDIILYDVNEKMYKGKMDVKWLGPLAKTQQEILE